MQCFTHSIDAYITHTYLKSYDSLMENYVKAI